MIHTHRVLQLASAAALLLALSQPGLASTETTVGPSSAAVETQTDPAPTVTPSASAPSDVESQAVAPEPEAAAPGPESAVAESPAPEAAAPEPRVAETPAAEPTPGQDARTRAESRQAELRTERNARYEELRARAAEVGVDLPQTPPWEAMPQMPEMPGQAGVSAPDWEAIRAEREAMQERFKALSPEERRAVREAHWQKMRERAAARGVEIPQTPPWEEAENRYKAAQEQFDRYRKIVDEMTEEQLEAARALFGHGEAQSQSMAPSQIPQQTPSYQGSQQMPYQMPQQMPYQMPQQMPYQMPQQMPYQMPQQMPRMPQQGFSYGPQGSHPGYGPYQGGSSGMGPMPMPRYEGGVDQGPPPPRGVMPY